MFGLIHRLAEWLDRKITATPSADAQCLCPGCRTDLCSDPDAIYSDTDVVRYICGDCGTLSEWNFGMPVPVLLRHERI